MKRICRIINAVFWGVLAVACIVGSLISWNNVDALSVIVAVGVYGMINFTIAGTIDDTLKRIMAD